MGWVPPRAALRTQGRSGRRARAPHCRGSVPADGTALAPSLDTHCHTDPTWRWGTSHSNNEAKGAYKGLDKDEIWPCPSAAAIQVPQRTRSDGGVRKLSCPAQGAQPAGPQGPGPTSAAILVIAAPFKPWSHSTPPLTRTFRKTCSWDRLPDRQAARSRAS